MLKLEKMEISGFKSFSDRTEIRFPTGITAVVGPNGCGKSNIGDAVNWVLGEQSPRMLRGKHMTDVIFNGSRARKPLGLAEVSLHMGGAEGLPFGDQGRIVVTRRLFRSGESEYLINGKRTRLKDIQELLDQGRVGARSYATIEQGKIDQILNAKPKDRRQIIEDAAGIAGYKNKRRLTELKLEATHANLLRVNDIAVEVERQIRSLKRQAGKARRYRRLRDELREKERVRFGRRALELDGALSELRDQEARARDQEAGAAARASRAEVELVEDREELERQNRAFREAAERLHQLELELDRSEGQIVTCKERISAFGESVQRQESEADTLESRLRETEQHATEQRATLERGRSELTELGARLTARQEALDALERQHAVDRDDLEELRRQLFDSMHRAAELRNQLGNAGEALERHATRRSRLEAENSEACETSTRLKDEADSLGSQVQQQQQVIEASRQAQAGTDEELVVARAGHTESSGALAAAREEEQSALSQLATLEDVDTRFAGVSDGVRTLLSAGPAAGVRASGVVADFIEAGQEIEGAAQGYLNEFLPTVIVEGDADVQRASDLLRREGAGRTCLISRAQPVGRPAVGSAGNGKGAFPRELIDDPRVTGRLRERLTLHTSANGFIEDRLGDAVLVDSLGSALALHRAFPDADFLTPGGDVVYASGVVETGGKPTHDRGLLAHRRKTQEARARTEQAGQGVARLQQRVDDERADVDRLEAELQQGRDRLEQAQRDGVTLKLQHERLLEECDRSRRERTVLTDELSGLGEESERSDRERNELQAQVEQSERDHLVLEESLASRNADTDRSTTGLRELAEQLAVARAEQAAGLQRQAAVEQEGRRLEDAKCDLGTRAGQLRDEVGESRRRSGEAEQLLVATEKELVNLLAQREKQKSDNLQTEQRIAGRQRELTEREGSLRSSRQELEALREATREAEIGRTRAEADRTHLDALCQQELGVSASVAAESVDDEAAKIDLQELEGEIEGLRARIDRIGPVNLTAIEEFSELEERHGFLSAQREDLEQSMTSLRETIRRINRSSREQFNVAFESIRRSFQEIFKLLFNGGRADLQMEEGEDVLECGIEIMAQPPGKRLGSVQLLSGGEKAMSAIALLFAVFRFQPSPFCLLDEVDAALDDANVGRFTRMLQEYAEQTQFIVVTHNKISMEAANLMYGVTMEEPGVSRVLSIQFEQ